MALQVTHALYNHLFHIHIMKIKKIAKNSFYTSHLLEIRSGYEPLNWENE